ncbi:MAG: helicase [Thelocarpon superellum]|nr:MAG: helicase [Thelocarpon superellum]
MYRKPFRPPLLKRASSFTIEEVPLTPPSKKPRLSSDRGEGAERREIQDVRQPFSDLEENTTGPVAVKPRASDPGRYFAVLWRKCTAKKHKTWDGDGMLSLVGGYAHLRDVSGKDLGRAKFEAPLLPGSALVVAGKDVEVDALLSKEEARAQMQPARTAIPRPSPKEVKPAAKPLVREIKPSAFYRPIQRTGSGRTAGNGHFKTPLRSTTVLPKPDVDAVVPRHDPTEAGALVMKRPGSAPSGKRLVDVVVDPLLTRRLREHQREGIKFLYECVMGMRPYDGQGAILADEMGLGKTLQTIALIWTLLKQNPIYEDAPVIKKALIVCPVTLISNWRKEFRKWLGSERLGVFVADGANMRLRDFTVGRSYSVMIIGYEKLRTVQEELKRGSGIDLVVADEGHRLKTAQNKSAKAIRGLNASRRIILSGTPIQNDLSEFFEMVDFVNPGLLNTYASFRKDVEGPIVRSRQPGALKKEVADGEAQSRELAACTQPFILRRTAEVLAKYLQPKTEYVLFCRPTTTQADVYRAVLSSPLFSTVLGSPEASLQLITLLKKVCNSPTLLAPRAGVEGPANASVATLLSSIAPTVHRASPSSSSAKLKVLDRLLHHLRKTTSEKVVLVSNYTSTLDLLQMHLTARGYHYLRLDGSTPTSKRQDLVDTFNRTTASMCFVFLLSAKAGGAGINLIGASRLVLFDVDWNPSTDLQAMARIHRDGQKRPVHIYRLLVAGALDEKVWQRQITKIGLADSVMDQKTTASSFSTEELRDLFTLDETASCQTHDLLGCSCGGDGGHPAARAAELLPTKASDVREDEDEEDDDDVDLLPMPTLVKASDLHRSNQANEASTKTETKSRKKKRMASLMQYTHIDTSRFGCLASPHDGKKGLSADDHADDDAGEGGEGEEEGEETTQQRRIKALRRFDDEDEVLSNVLKEEGNRVAFVFVKSTKKEVEEREAVDAVDSV